MRKSQGSQVANLIDEVLFLVVELVIVGPVRLEVGEKANQFVAILEEDQMHWMRLRRARHKHLKVKARQEVSASVGLKLNMAILPHNHQMIQHVGVCLTLLYQNFI